MDAPVTVGRYGHTVALVHDAAGVLIIRVWRDEQAPRDLRIRVTRKLDVSQAVETTSAFSAADSFDAVCDEVREFLLTFAATT